MIHEYDLETKDFSGALPAIINKILAVNSAILFELNGDSEPSLNIIDGWYHILSNAIEDLSVINKILYGP